MERPRIDRWELDVCTSVPVDHNTKNMLEDKTNVTRLRIIRKKKTTSDSIRNLMKKNYTETH